MPDTYRTALRAKIADVTVSLDAVQDLPSARCAQETESLLFEFSTWVGQQIAAGIRPYVEAE